MPIKYGAMIRQTGGKLLRKACGFCLPRLPKLPTVNLVLVKLTLRQNCLTEKAQILPILTVGYEPAHA